MPKDIGNLIGKNIDASTSQASAVWKIQDQIRFKRSGSWPSLTNITSQYQISRSLMFNSPDSSHLSRSFGTPTTNTVWTLSIWVKRSQLGASPFALFSAGTSEINFQNDVIYFYSAGPSTAAVSTAVFRDPSSWYHVVFVSNGATVTGYVNSNLVINYTGTLPQFNSVTTHTIGKYASSSADYFSGYLADIHFIDGQALTPNSFGETDSNGEWQPKAYIGSYGNNGFKLDFADNSANTSNTLGKDTSGNGNNWTPYNLNVGNMNPTTFVAPGVNDAVNGTIANGGTPYWIDVLPTSANLSYSGGTMINVHDGNLSSYAYWVGDEYVIGNVMQARLDLRDFPIVTSVRIYSVGISGYVSYFARLLDASKNVIGGTTIDISPISLAWNSVPVAGSPRYLEIYTTSGIARRVFLHEIEVNGIRLTNNIAGRGNIFVDTPTSYGNGSPTFDTGVGAEVRGNYCTWNPLSTTSGTFSDGNLKYTGPGAWARANGTLSVNSGKWYWEIVITSNPSSGFGGRYNGWGVGLVSTHSSTDSQPTDAFVYWDVGFYQNWSATTIGTSSVSTGDIISFALDCDTNMITVRKNNTVIVSLLPLGTTSGNRLCPFHLAYNDTFSPSVANFGQLPFVYTAPSGFRALCDSNLSEPTIINPSTVMDTNLYTGNGSSITVSQLNFSPDLVWIKSRSGNTDHALYDTVRGATLDIASNLTTGQTTQSTGLTSFLSNGFSLGSLLKVNSTSSAYVSWCWDAGSGSAVLNQQGDTNSVVKANIGAGFSIATFTSPSSPGAYSVGHGLGVKPNFTIIKRINDGDSWFCWHIGLGDNLTEYLMLYSIAGQITQGGMWGTIGRTVNACGFASQISTFAASNYVMYNFAPVDGYSSFGKYTGNGSANGPFVFCNFRPKFLMIKRTDTLSNWRIFDSRRPGYNVTNLTLIPNSSSNESTLSVDFLSNGFKLRDADTDTNAVSGIYIYSAFAESPFKYARAR